MAKKQSLLVKEVFYSLQGESNTTGVPTVFIRLTGCPRRCSYCDTAYAFYGGTHQSIRELLDTVAQYATHYVTVTGGEPLAQPLCYELLQCLVETGYHVSVETSGTVPLGDLDKRVVVVMDLKTPSSGEMAHNCYDNIERLSLKDQVKFVIGDAQDYSWACQTINQYSLTKKVDTVLFSPTYQQLSEATLAEWILRDQLSVRMQIQLHKLLWGDVAGR